MMQPEANFMGRKKEHIRVLLSKQNRIDAGTASAENICCFRSLNILYAYLIISVNQFLTPRYFFDFLNIL